MQFVIGLLGAIIGFSTFVIIFNWLDQMDLCVGGGDKGPAIGGLIIGLPLGCAVGFIALDKFKEVNSKGLLKYIISLISGVFGALIGVVWIVNAVGNASWVVVPLIVVSFSIFGYHIESLLRRF